MLMNKFVKKVFWLSSTTLQPYLSRRWCQVVEIPGTVVFYDGVIQLKHFPRFWPFVRGIHRSPVDSPHKGQWRGALKSSLICAWTSDWVNNREPGDLRRHHVHYIATVTSASFVFIVSTFVTVIVRAIAIVVTDVMTIFIFFPIFLPYFASHFLRQFAYSQQAYARWGNIRRLYQRELIIVVIITIITVTVLAVVFFMFRFTHIFITLIFGIDLNVAMGRKIDDFRRKCVY